MPYYQVKIIRVNQVNPIYSIFPGEKIRLNFDFNNNIYRDEIKSAHWSLLKENITLYEKEGREPTITLPPTEGGSYHLRWLWDT